MTVKYNHFQQFFKLFYALVSILTIMVPYHESRLYWVHDPAPSPPRRMEHTKTVPPSDSSAPVFSKSSVSNSMVTVFPFPVILCAPLINQCLCVINMKTRRPPLLRAAQQELLSPHLFLRNTGGGGGDRLREQPIGIRLLVPLPQ